MHDVTVLWPECADSGTKKRYNGSADLFVPSGNFEIQKNRFREPGRSQWQQHYAWREKTVDPRCFDSFGAADLAEMGKDIEDDPAGPPQNNTVPSIPSGASNSILG